MLRYQYDRLFVSAYDPREFDPRNPASLRQAVDHLRTLNQTGFVCLIAEVLVPAATFKLRASASLKLAEIIGKTPAQVWTALDQQVDQQIRYYEKRGSSKFGSP